MTAPPLIPWDPAPRRRRRGRRLLLALVVLLALAALAVAAVAVVRREEGARGAAVAAGASPTASPAPSASGATVFGSLSPSPSPSASASRSPAAMPPRPHLVTDPQPVPILVYHHVVEKPKGPPLVVMSTRRFRVQMAWLADHGYQAVTLRRVYDAWTGQGTLPARPVVLSFDDGYADQVRNAAPVLREYGWPGELDLVSTALYLGDDPPATSLTPDMVRSLLGDGWELSSHSVGHLDLTRLWGDELRHELVDSRARLEELFGVKVDFFCYPGGIYDRRVKLAVRRYGYLGATGTRYAAATPRDLFSMARIYAYRGESTAAFASRLEDIMAAEER